MPISTSTLEQHFSTLSTEDNVVEKVSPAFITPTKAERDNFSDDDDSCSDGSPVAVSPSNAVLQVIKKTDHKLLEESGALVPEPLLVENPHRFVIFPIQDNDVSLFYLIHNNPLVLSRRMYVYYYLFLLFHLTSQSDLIFIIKKNVIDVGNVQKGGSILLDCRRN